MDYKSLMGYGDKKTKESKPKQNKIVEELKQEFNINEGPAYEYKKHSKKIEKSLKDLQKNYLDNYKKNVVGFTKKYKKDFGKLM
jgi:hypothetical protein